MKKIGGCAVFAAVLLAACSGSDSADDSTECTMEAEAGILVTVVDATNETSLTTYAEATITDGSYLEEVGSPSDPTVTKLMGAVERPGTYTVTVSSQGYQDWTATDVEVKSGTCHVETVELTAELQPAV